ncbi:MAG TPA: RecX family transcriptional regulator [Gaiellaceae bacterium]|nr:RecX family transcriptional regulator [Gaiellaceae bacterium]
MGDTARDARAAGLRALRARDHTRASLAARLARGGLDEESCQDAVEALARAGYVDDERFARGRAMALARRGAGDELIRDDLERQGVAPALAALALGDLEPERIRARRVVAARGRSARTLRFLAAKGFAEESLEPFVADVER